MSPTPGLAGHPLDPLSWQINSILAISGRKNSIRILNQSPFFQQISIWAYIICFIKFLLF